MSAIDLRGLDLAALSRPELLSALWHAAARDRAAAEAHPLYRCGRLAEFYNPNQPRVPAGSAGGGRWAQGAGDAAVREWSAGQIRAFVAGYGPARPKRRRPWPPTCRG